MPDTGSRSRWLPPALVILLVAVWLGGGVTSDATPIDEWLQLLSLPVMVLSIAALLQDWPQDRLSRCGVAVAVAIAGVPLLQLLPLPASWWAMPPARMTMAADLSHAGVASELHHRWSLTPGGTEQALWALLPALAAFLAGLATPGSFRRRVVQAIIGLVLLNAVFAFFQAGLPEDSSLKLYPNVRHGFGGVLINTNHQATALITGMVLATGLAVDGWRRVRKGDGNAVQRVWLYAAVAIACLLLIPLSTSRAGVAIALPALAVTLLLAGIHPAAVFGGNKRVTASALAALAVGFVGVRVALGWMAVEQAEGLRFALSRAAMDIARLEAPWGSGVGSLVQVFEQEAPPALLLSNYVNHVHNEYAQWWLTSGWLGAGVLLAALAVLAVAGWRIARVQKRGSDSAMAASAFVAILAVLVHSWVDYPLRTTTLMATTAALAGLMLAALADARLRSKARQRPPVNGEGLRQPA